MEIRWRQSILFFISKKSFQETCYVECSDFLMFVCFLMHLILGSADNLVGELSVFAEAGCGKVHKCEWPWYHCFDTSLISTSTA